MDGIKLYAKSERDINWLIHLTRVFSNDIDMTFGLGKRDRLIFNRGSIKHTDGDEMPNGHIDDIAERYNYLGIQQAFGNDDNEVRCKAISVYKS